MTQALTREALPAVAALYIDALGPYPGLVRDWYDGLDHYVAAYYVAAEC